MQCSSLQPPVDRNYLLSLSHVGVIFVHNNNNNFRERERDKIWTSLHIITGRGQSIKTCIIIGLKITTTMTTAINIYFIYSDETLHISLAFFMYCIMIL